MPPQRGEDDARPAEVGAASVARRRLVLAAAALPFAAALPGRGEAAAAAVAARIWPAATWATATAAEAGLDKAKLDQALAYGAARGGSGFVVRNGYHVGGWGSPATAYELFSSTKSFASILLGIAVKDGLVRLDDRAQTLLPTLGVPPQGNKATGWLPLITVEQLATHAAGFEKRGGFRPLLFRPGTTWSYSDGGVNWLADVLTVTFGRDLALVLRERVLTPLRIGPAALTWRENGRRPPLLNGIPRREAGTSINASVDAMARVGLLATRGGRWRQQQILDAGYAAAMGAARPSLAGLEPQNPEKFPDAPRHYGLLWWTNADGAMPGVPRDAFWSWGASDSLILAVPSLDLVAARAGGRGSGWAGTWSGRYSVVEPFFTPLAQAVTR